jgi:outer membrane protein OmpA-like peptidoglycan-associated protein
VLKNPGYCSFFDIGYCVAAPIERRIPPVIRPAALVFAIVCAASAQTPNGAQQPVPADPRGVAQATPDNRQPINRFSAVAQVPEHAATEAETKRAEVREHLRKRLGLILETQETPRGLAVNLGDALFDSRQVLKPAAREDLSRISGVLLAYPGLKVRIEGQSSAADEAVSRQRAEAVRALLLAEGLPADAVTLSVKRAEPAGANESGASQQQNRTLELVIFGTPIGVEQSRPVPAPH